ncbi:MAG TPA: TonB-dependent receptor [Candidatus Didemnitutus sp.]|nr:TonB-dependent receptor [Candidatus Didemnitutus sp.]
MHTEGLPAGHRRHRHRLIAVALLSAAATLSTLAQSTNTTTDDTTPKKEDKPIVLETFEVSGSFAGSLAAATQAKQQSVNITEQLMAEDLGKLPDVSIADSLVHLPGVAAQRTNGRSQQISIRGLTGDFQVTTLNGHQQVSTSENRAVEYDQYPAELISQVTIYKTANADQTAQGLAGSVDLKTIQPLDLKGQAMSISAFYQGTQYNRLTPGAKKDGERFTVSYVNQYEDGTIGLAVGFAHTDTPWEGKQFQAWGWPTIDAANDYVLGGTKSYVRTSNLKRDGLMAVLEYKPSSTVHSTFELFRSNFEEKSLLRGLEIPLWWSSAALQPGYTVTNGLVTNGVFSNVMPVDRNDIFDRKDNLVSAGWKLQVGDPKGWSGTLDTSYSKVTRKDENLETYSGLSFRGVPFTTADSITFTEEPGQIPVLTSAKDYSTGTGFKLSDPQGWGPSTLPGGGMYGYLKYFQSKDELGQVKIAADRKLNGMFKDVEFGVDFTERYKRDGESPTGYMDSPTGQVTLPLPAIIGQTDMSFLGLGKVYAYDPQALLDSGTIGFVPLTDLTVPTRKFRVTEKLTTPYAQLNIETKMGSVPVTGNVGIQAIHADQSAAGYATDGSALYPVTGGATYTDWAPSLNLNFTLDSSDILRFSAARQVARPRMYDMRAGRSFSYNPAFANSTDLAQSPWNSGEAGNPQLRPWKANSLDLSYEHYFADDKGYFSIAGYYKKLLTFIYTQNSIASFAGYPTYGTDPKLLEGLASQAENGNGGSIKGVEVAVRLPSELISKSIKGIGLEASGAYTDSSIEPWGPGNGTAPIAGLSRKVAQITLYYENHGFSARVSEHYRSENRQYITTFGPPSPGGDVNPNGGFSVAQPEKVVDAQISYAFQTGTMKGITLYLQAYNLNNEPLVTYNNGDPRQVMNYQKYGASYSAGVSYKF